MSGFSFSPYDYGNPFPCPMSPGYTTISVDSPDVQQSQGTTIFYDPLTGILITAGVQAPSGGHCVARVQVYNPIMPVTLGPGAGAGGGLLGFPLIPAGPPPIPAPVAAPAPAQDITGYDYESVTDAVSEPEEAWPAPLALARPGPNVQLYIDAINRFMARGRFAWVNHMNGAQTIPVNGFIEAVGSVLEKRNTVFGTLWNGGGMIMNMTEAPDEVTAGSTVSVYGHMVCRLAGYMMEWQPRRRDHPEAVSFIVRPVDKEGACAVDHRGYMERTFKDLGMKWVEMQYREGEGPQYVAVAFKGVSSPMMMMSSGWYLTVEGGLKQGEPQWPI